MIAPVAVAPIAGIISAALHNNAAQELSNILDIGFFGGIIGSSIASLNYDYSSISIQEHMFAVA